MKIPLKNLVQSWLGSAPLHASPRHFGLWSGCRDGGARPACRTEVRRDGVAGPAGIPGVVGILHPADIIGGEEVAVAGLGVARVAPGFGQPFEERVGQRGWKEP